MRASEVPALVALVATTKFRGRLARHRLCGHLRGSHAIARAAAYRARASRGRHGARASSSPRSASAYPAEGEPRSMSAQHAEEEPRRALCSTRLPTSACFFVLLPREPRAEPSRTPPHRTQRAHHHHGWHLASLRVRQRLPDRVGQGRESRDGCPCRGRRWLEPEPKPPVSTPGAGSLAARVCGRRRGRR